jgi:hypothetical protein
MVTKWGGTGGGERRAVLEGLSGPSKGGREAGREEGGAPPSRPQLAILVAACCRGHRLQGARQRYSLALFAIRRGSPEPLHPVASTDYPGDRQ